MDLVTLIFAAAPVLIFYLIYFRYFSIKTVFSKQLQSLLAGMSIALLMLLAAPFLHSLLGPFNRMTGVPSALVVGFFQAALPEKGLALVTLLLIFKRYPKFSVLEGTLSAMMFGLGFAIIENFAYAALFGKNIIIIRLIYSVPLHITTCGITGYFLGLGKFSVSPIIRNKYVIYAFFSSLLLHGIFDTLLLSQGRILYLSALLLILMVLCLEYLLAKAQNTVSRDYLTAAKLDFEGWQTISRQPGFERWILRSSGMPRIQQAGLFQWKPGVVRFIFVIFFFVLSIYGMAHKDFIINNLLNITISSAEQVTLLGVLPSMISMIIILVGAVNPRFFKESELKIPIITDAVAHEDQAIEETFVTYEITPVNCFLKTPDRIGIGKRLAFTFESGKNRFSLEAVVVWENHINRREPFGTLISFKKKSADFYAFYLRYILFRYWKGLLFNLRVPGYEITRRLFMRPISTMQDEKLYKCGDIIFKECDPGDEFFLLKKGSVLFYKRKKDSSEILKEIITMGTVSSGEIFGEMAIIGENSRAASAICVGDCLIASAKKENIRALVENNPEFAMSLIQTLIERLQMSEKILVDRICKQ